MAEPVDHYAALGVSRTADEREIKRAYFRLIRRYSPESHPEEFGRLRAAYELLLNPAARREYDQITQYGAEIGQRLRAGMEAMDRGDLLLAQAEFKQILLERPDLHMARDLLGMAFLNNRQPKEALQQFALLVDLKDDAGSATYHLHQGYAHYALDEYTAALHAYRRARELDPDETRVLCAMADCYTAMERYDEALAELSAAVPAVDREQGRDLKEKDWVLLLRKVQIQLLRDRPDLAEREIDSIERLLPEDAQVRKFVAQKILSLCAQLFRIKRSADGNRLLRRAHTIYPHGPTGPAGRRGGPLTLPARVTRHLADLPAQARGELARMAREPSPHKLLHSVWAGPALLLILSVGLCLFGAVQLLTSRGQWQGNTYVLTLLALLVLPGLLTLAISRIVRAARSPVGRFTQIHPLYLLQVDLDQVTAWPLPNLHDVSMTHHLQNGVYQYTVLKADFAGTSLALTIRGQQTAVEWAQALLDARHRCLGLLAVGMLDEEEGWDLLLHEPPPARPRRRYLAYGAAAGAGALLCTAGAAVNARLAQEAAWQEGTSPPRAGGLRAYLLSYPRGPHAAEARAGLARLYEAAQARYLKRAGEAPGRQAILDVLAELARSPGREVWVRYAAQVEIPVLQGASLRRLEADITESLSAALQRAFSPDLIALVKGGRSEPRAETPGIEIAYRILPSGDLDHSTTDRIALHGLQIVWTLSLRTAGSAHTLSLTSQPGPQHSYWHAGTGTGEDDEDLPYLRMIDSAAEEFTQKLATHFGLPLPPRSYPAPDGVSDSRLSAEARRILRELSQRKNVSPQLLEEVNRLLRRKP